MKRMVIAGVAAGALALAATAQAERVNHVGELKGVPGSTVKFKESVKNDSSTVTSFAVRNFEVRCDGGELGEMKVAKLSGSIEVSPGGGFKAADDNGETSFKVKGKIGAAKSKGTFRYSGMIADTDGVMHDCDSGKLSWVTRP